MNPAQLTYAYARPISLDDDHNKSARKGVPAATPAVALAVVPEPTPGPGELLVRVAAASVNRGEIRTAARQPAGKVLGWDVTGTVEALGEGVAAFTTGERVVAISPGAGSFAEKVVVPAGWTAPLTDRADLVKIATLPVAGVTAVAAVAVTGRAGPLAWW